jgi:hypothetical protein
VGRTTRRRTTPLAGAAVLAVVLLTSGCGGHATSAGPWNLRGPANGSVLLLRIGIGSTSCDELSDVKVREDADEVHVTAVVRRTTGDGCSGDYGTVDREVRLQAPIGTRRLTGCRPQSPLTGGKVFGGDEDSPICFETAPTAGAVPSS